MGGGGGRGPEDRLNRDTLRYGDTEIRTRWVGGRGRGGQTIHGYLKAYIKNGDVYKILTYTQTYGFEHVY